MATRCSVTSLLLWEKGQHVFPGHEFIFLHEDSFLVHPLQHSASFCLHLLPDFITVNTGGCYPCQETHTYLTTCHPSLVNNCLRSLRHQHFTRPMRATLPFPSLPKPKTHDSENFTRCLCGKIHGSPTNCWDKPSKLKSLCFNIGSPKIILLKTIPHPCRQADRRYFLMSNTNPTSTLRAMALH